MAEQKKSIEISYKANISDLKKKLEQLPDITASEAKKMVSALDRQLKQAERAAKKSADASKKAAQASAQAAKKGSEEFNNLAVSSQKAADKLKNVGESSGDIDRGFSGIGLALRGVNPQLAEAADGLADTFAVVESLTVGFGALNPMVLAGAAAVGTITLGYMAYQSELEKTKTIILSVRDAQKQLNQDTKDQNANLADALNKVEAIQDQYNLLTGEITEYQFAINEAGRSAAEALQPNIDAQREIIKQRNKDLELIQKLFKLNQSLGTQAAILSEEEKARLQTLQFQNDAINNRVNLESKSPKVAAELAQLEKIIEKDLNRQNVILGGLETKRRQAVDQAKQIAEFEQETGEAEKFVTAQVENTNTSKQKQLELQQKINEDLKRFHEMQEQVFKAEDELARAFEQNVLNREEQLQSQHDSEVARILELGELTGELDKSKQIAAALDMKLEEELQELREKGVEKQKEAIEATTQQVIGGFGDLYSSLSDLSAAFADDTKEGNLQAFVMQKQLSTASIIMKTAEAIMAAQLLGPPLNAIQTGIAVATGAAQLAKVQSTQPPSFHMGGIAPDETTARVLKGEAVLSRGAVQRMGGEQGIRQIEQGSKQGDDRIVIIQPFKHFGRFARELGFQQPKQTGIRGY